MKKMLKISLLFIVITGMFFACAEDDDSIDEVIEFSALPTLAKSFVTTHYSEGSVTLVKQNYVAEPNGTYYKVYLTGSTEIDFDRLGNWIEIDSDTNALPQSIFDSSAPLTAISNYVKQNHTGLKIVELKLISGGYKIELSNGIDISFDSNGQNPRIEP